MNAVRFRYFDKAMADYSEAIRLRPDYAAAYHERGIACRNKGDFDKAQEDFAKAKELGYNAETASTGAPKARPKGCLGLVVATLLVSALVFAVCGFIVA